MKKIACIVFFFYSLSAHAQWNFWHSILNDHCSWTFLKNGNNILADDLLNFIKNATSSCTGKNYVGNHTVQYANGTIIDTQLVEYAAGSYSSLSLCDAVADSKMCMVRFKGDTTLSGTNMPTARKKGLVIYVDGNLTINSGGSISMTARGAIGAGQDIPILPGYSIPATGASGGVGYSSSIDNQNATTGMNGVNGQTGGGSGGTVAKYSNVNGVGGRGGNGTSYSGGPGGGGASTRSGYREGGAGSDTGGAGGCTSAGWDWTALSGVGNPPGGQCSAGVNNDNLYYERINTGVGTGGLIILFVKGNLVNNGSIQANGVNSSGAAGDTLGGNGGASGGGSVNIFRQGGTFTGTGSVTATGGQGVALRKAGDGTVRSVSVTKF